MDNTIYLDTGIGKKRLLINVSEKAKKFGKEWCKILLRVYVFTGEGFVSGFNVKSKVTWLEKMRAWLQDPKLTNLVFHLAVTNCLLVIREVNIV